MKFIDDRHRERSKRVVVVGRIKEVIRVEDVFCDRDVHEKEEEILERCLVSAMTASRRKIIGRMPNFFGGMMRAEEIFLKDRGSK